MLLKKKHKESTRKKKEEEYNQMWIDFKLIYNTLESQAIFVNGFCPKTPPTGVVYSTPQTSQLNITHFTRVRIARIPSTNPHIYFLYYPWVETHWRFLQKKSAAPYVRLGK